MPYETTGQYKHEDAQVTFNYTYEVYESVEQAVEELSAEVVLKLINRMSKVDSGNTSREKAKSANGHSTAKVLTEEQKLANKTKRAEDKGLLSALKASGMSVDDIKALVANAVG